MAAQTSPSLCAGQGVRPKKHEVDGNGKISICQKEKEGNGLKLREEKEKFEILEEHCSFVWLANSSNRKQKERDVDAGTM